MNNLDANVTHECVDLEIKPGAKPETLHELQTKKQILENGLDLECKDK